MEVLRAGAAEAGMDPKLLGTHSLRIGGATALFEGNESALTIQTMGRWSGDLYQLCVRACRVTLLAGHPAAGQLVVDAGIYI